MRKAIGAAVVAFLFAAGAQAAVLTSYGLGYVGGTSVSGSSAAGVSASSLTTNGYRPFYTPSNVLGFETEFTFGRDTGNYIEWSIGPASGYRVTLQQINLSSYLSHDNGVQRMDFWSSSGGYFANRTLGMSDFLVDHTIVLDTSYQNLTGPVTFRLYTYNPVQGVFGVSNHSSGSFNVSGTVTAIPEPAMLAGAVLLVPLLSRRRQNA